MQDWLAFAEPKNEKKKINSTHTNTNCLIIFFFTIICVFNSVKNMRNASYSHVDGLRDLVYILNTVLFTVFSDHAILHFLSNCFRFFFSLLLRFVNSFFSSYRWFAVWLCAFFYYFLFYWLYKGILNRLCDDDG